MDSADMTIQAIGRATRVVPADTRSQKTSRYKPNDDIAVRTLMACTVSRAAAVGIDHALIEPAEEIRDAKARY